MTKEIEWYRTAQGATDEGVSGPVYRAIRWDKEKWKYVLISGRQNAGYSGDTNVTRIEFEDPKILADAIVMLGANREVFIQAEGTVTRIHEDWRGYRAPQDVKRGQVNLALKAEHGALAAFESTIQINVE